MSRTLPGCTYGKVPAAWRHTGKYVSPKVYDELEKATGVDRRTIQDYKTVADRVSAERHADLGFSHHREVAPLEPSDQKKFLQKASDEKLSVRERAIGPPHIYA